MESPIRKSPRKMNTPQRTAQELLQNFKWSVEDERLLVDWIEEHLAEWNELDGGDAKKMHWVFENCDIRPRLSKNYKSRHFHNVWKALRSKYQAAQRRVNTTGSGVTEDERNEGLKNIDGMFPMNIPSIFFVYVHRACPREIVITVPKRHVHPRSGRTATM
jgi:hypothetical protein